MQVWSTFVIGVSQETESVWLDEPPCAPEEELPEVPPPQATIPVAATPTTKLPITPLMRFVVVISDLFLYES